MNSAATGGAALAVAVLLGCACSSERCEPTELPVEMSRGRAAELAPDVTRGLAVSTSLRATACPTVGEDGGVLAPTTACGDQDCGARRRALEVLVLPLGTSVPRREPGCLRTRDDLAPLAAAQAISSERGELVVALPAGDIAVYLIDPTSGCAACGRLEAGEACDMVVPAAGLVVRDLLLDRL